jgi:hypothetical protein
MSLTPFALGVIVNLLFVVVTAPRRVLNGRGVAARSAIGLGGHTAVTMFVKVAHLADVVTWVMAQWFGR